MDLTESSRSFPCPMNARIYDVYLLLVTAAWSLLSSRCFAHDLEMDTFSLRLDTTTGAIAGQLLVDPDESRPGWPDANPAETVGPGPAHQNQEQLRLLSFMKEHVHLLADDAAVQVEFEVRELYVRGGAVPGDSVIYHANLPKDALVLSVRFSPPLDQLAISVSIDGKPKPSMLASGAGPVLLHEKEAPRVATPYTQDATGSAPSPPSLSPNRRAAGKSSRSPVSTVLAIGESIWLGIVHIVPRGWDHILFIVALTLGSLCRYRRLIIELSAFTVAHTVTLGLGSLGAISLPSSIVEPFIAFSIAAVALERLLKIEKSVARLFVVTLFGLIHGLGFAGALRELGFSGGSFLLYLASFNFGVELGQLVVVSVTLAGLALCRRWPKATEKATLCAEVTIAICGLWLGTARLLDSKESSTPERDRTETVFRQVPANDE